MAHRKKAGVAGGQIEFIDYQSERHSVFDTTQHRIQRLVAGHPLAFVFPDDEIVNFDHVGQGQKYQRYLSFR